jgi:3-oxoacyl-[acyl-carrier-protein] synthase-3
VLFGDGAGAVVVGETEPGRGILGSHAGSDGSGAYYIFQKIGAGAHPFTEENILSSDRYMKMNGREVFKFAVRIFNDAVLKALENANLGIENVDLFVPHQANVRIINAAMEKFGFERDRVIINMDRYGNTSAASIPLALNTAREEGKLAPGKTCALVAFGAGLTYAATVLKW